MENLYYASMKSPMGKLWIAVSDKGLVLIEFGKREFPPLQWRKEFNWVISEEKTETARRQLQQYFDGHRTEFTLPLDLRRGTGFQKKCWEVLVAIPYGEIRTYQQVAEAVGSPNAFRAVGQANHANPIPIVIPCHRVINSDGNLGGYGGGLEMKEQLLALERALPVEGPLFESAKAR